MIRYLHKLRADNNGNTGIAVIVASPALIAMMLMLVSAQQYWDANRQAQAIAAEAARIGAQSDSDNVRADSFQIGVWTMSPNSQTNAENFIATVDGASGSVQQGAAPLTVESEVELEVEYIFPINLLPERAEGTSVAVVIRGVEDGITP